MATEVFNRYEHKYLLDIKVYEKVISIITEHMTFDLHNAKGKPYTIANIYYDTADDYLIRTSLSKPEYKEKLRLRAYCVPHNTDKVFLEIKKKYHGIVNKRRTAMRLDDAYSFIETGVTPIHEKYINMQVVNELEYFLKIHKVMPKLYLAYDRVAFFDKDNPDLRISFDTNIRSRRYNLRLEDGCYGEQLVDNGIYLMEIKTSLAKPLWLTHMLSGLDIKRCHFSKYGTEYRQHLNKLIPTTKTAI